jgi:hypothetical protein
MAVRTTIALVAGIIEVDEEIPLAPFISAASSLVDRISNYAVANNLLVDGPNSDDKTREEKLQEIETFLSAHFYTLRDPRSVSEGAGGVSVSYQSRVDLRLFTSHYGQMACVLDETGILEQINSGKKAKTAQFNWMGKCAPSFE